MRDRMLCSASSLSSHLRRACTPRPLKSRGMLDYIPAGTSYDDLVAWRGKRPGDVLTAEVARRIDTIVCSPHDSAALPEELRPFVSPRLTRRLAADYSDCTVRAIALAWVALDDGVIFVACPHSRAVVDANRARSDDPTADLAEFYARLARQRAGEPGVSFKGVDSIRPVTFGGRDVLIEPADDAGRAALRETLRACAARGAVAYEAAVEEAVAAVVDARRDGDGGGGTRQRPLMLISWHDTCSFKAAADGALTVERPVADRMPSLVNFGNRGDVCARPLPGGGALTPGREMRRVAAAWAEAFGIAQDFFSPPPHACDAPISFNRPYPGGHEAGVWAERLRAAGARATVFQVEFDRAALLGPTATAALQSPGDGWPATDEAHVAELATKLKRAADLLRSGDSHCDDADDEVAD